MKKLNILKKNTQLSGKYYTRLVFLNNLSHFWSQRNSIFYKNEISKISYTYIYLKFILSRVVKLYLYNEIKNKIDIGSISLNENISKKYFNKNLELNNFFLKNDIYLYRNNYLTFNSANVAKRIPNFTFDLSYIPEFKEIDFDSVDFALDKTLGYSFYAEYVYTYTFK